MDNNDNLARVSIFGHEYTVKAPTDSTYIKNIAEFVIKLDNKFADKKYLYRNLYNFV